MYGYYRLASAVPTLKVADVAYNVEQIISGIKEAQANDAAVIVFPELSVTGYTCGDLFFQPTLQEAALKGVQHILEQTKKLPILSIVGLPFVYQSAIYNTAFVLQAGKILGIVPKTMLPNYREFYEKRQFVSAINPRHDASIPKTIKVLNQDVPFGTKLIFKQGGTPLSCAIEICEDLWSVVPPSSQHCLAGATTILNPSAGTELTGKANYRRGLVSQQSGRCLAAYVLSSAGVHESTMDFVFAGHSIIAENGRLATESPRFSRTTTFIYADIDLERLKSARISESSFNDNYVDTKDYQYIEIPQSITQSPDLRYAHNPKHPFLPPTKSRTERCQEIIDIQATGLAKRIEHTNAKTLVIGVSGGLDSTLALLICDRALKLLNRPASDILAITMPGFGTTGRTYNNAVQLCQLLHTSLREINIKEACLMHFKDIGHDPAEHTTTYENVQARERTQILMDLSNKLGGMVIGTGDLSEIALGWSTYNGDHMSMYAVNCSIPKSLIRCLIQHVAENSSEELAHILQDINDTPVSPELLPPSDHGDIEQKTEDVLGPYEIHDFFLYHFIKYGAPKEKLLYLAKHAFAGDYDSALIEKCLDTFIRRFFTQQFKRSCIPDGPKVGTISLSPRGDWRMPSDAGYATWM